MEDLYQKMQLIGLFLRQVKLKFSAANQSYQENKKASNTLRPSQDATDHRNFSHQCQFIPPLPRLPTIATDYTNANLRIAHHPSPLVELIDRDAMPIEGWLDR